MSACRPPRAWRGGRLLGLPLRVRALLLRLQLRGLDPLTHLFPGFSGLGGLVGLRLRTGSGRGPRGCEAAATECA